MMKRPNIVIIYPDQMRADAMSCAGNPCVETPHLDRLASQGIRFNNAFTSFPLCCPFRASLMTGKYAHSTGMHANHYPIPPGQDFLAAILRDNGYQTGYIGKWHLNGGKKHEFVPEEERLGFSTFIGFSRGHNYFESIFYRDDDTQPRTCERYEPDYQTDHLIEFMEASLKDPEARPFFGMICYGPPHPPLVAPEHYLNRYSPDDVPINENTPNNAEARTKAREFLAKYYGLVANVDDNIGRVMDWIDARGLKDNTLVIVVSDHGDMAGEHDRYSKKTYYRSSMQVPMIVRYPALSESSRVVEDLVDPSVDTMPTILELCGIPVPEAVQGRSFRPALEGSSQPARSAVHYEILMEKEGPERFPVPERGIRTREWLYVRTKEGPEALFDLKDDPLEMNNLVDSADHAGTMASFDRQISEHMMRTNDHWDIQAMFPPPDFQTHSEGSIYAKKLLKHAIMDS